MTSNHTLTNDSYQDEYDDVLDRFGLLDREARRTQNGKAKPKPKKSATEVVAQLTENAAGLEAGFQITYKPKLFETQWLLDSLRIFYDQGLIVDVLSQVKGQGSQCLSVQSQPGHGPGSLCGQSLSPAPVSQLAQ